MKRSQKRKQRREIEYRTRLQIGFIASLLLLISAFQLDIDPPKTTSVQAKPVVFEHMLETPQTKIEEKVIPPKPQIPVAVDDDIVLEDDVLPFDAMLDIDTQWIIEAPPPIEETTEDEEVLPFLPFEDMPGLIGGMAALMKEIEYPEIAKKANVEGKVIIQFVVNKAGEVVQPIVLKSLGGGCDEAALEAIKKMKFKPGQQRGKPVAVRMSLPVVFKLK